MHSCHTDLTKPIDDMIIYVEIRVFFNLAKAGRSETNEEICLAGILYSVVFFKIQYFMINWNVLEAF